MWYFFKFDWKYWIRKFLNRCISRIVFLSHDKGIKWKNSENSSLFEFFNKSHNPERELIKLDKFIYVSYTNIYFLFYFAVYLLSNIKIEHGKISSMRTFNVNAIIFSRLSLNKWIHISTHRILVLSISYYF
jgi:hypothetical protein